MFGQILQGKYFFKVLFIASHIANTLMWRGLMIFSFAAAVKFPAISISCKSEQQMRKPNRWHEIEKLPPQPRDTPGLRPCRQQLHSSPWVDLIGYFSHNKHLHLLHPPRPEQFTLHNVAVEYQTRVFLHKQLLQNSPLQIHSFDSKLHCSCWQL